MAKGITARLVYVRLEANVHAPVIKARMTAIQLAARMRLDPIGLDKAFDDAIEASDSAPEIAVGKGLSDAIAASDSPPAIDFGKGLADSMTATDGSVQIDVSKFLSDSIAASESGRVVVQSYAEDPFYFASDYAGTSRNF